MNWLEPVVDHEAGELRRDVERQFPLVHPALAGWTPESGDAGNWRLVNRLDQTDAASAGFRQLLALEDPVTLSRPVAVATLPTTVYLTLGRSIASEGATLDLWVGSKRVLRETVPRHKASIEPLRIAIPLTDVKAKSVLLTVRLTPSRKSALLDWRGLSDEHGKPIAGAGKSTGLDAIE